MTAEKPSPAERIKPILILAAGIIVMWLVITGLQWGFEQTWVVSKPCSNATYGYWEKFEQNGDINTTALWYDYGYYPQNSDWYTSRGYHHTNITSTVCPESYTKQYYTLAEILGMQRDWIIGIGQGIAAQPGNLYGWASQHKVM